MPAGRPNVPDALKKLRGTFRKDRAQLEIKLDKIENIPPSPETLSEAGKREWYRLAEMLVAMKIFTVADINTLEAYCDAYASWKEAEDHLKVEGKVIINPMGHQVQNQWWRVRNKCLDQMKSYGSELGFSPSARAKLKAPSGPEKNEYEEFRLRSTAS